MLIQDSGGRTERGAATASNLFARNLGSTLETAVLGTVLNASLARDHSGKLTLGRSYGPAWAATKRKRLSGYSTVSLAHKS